jgi:hypothetical protein
MRLNYFFSFKSLILLRTSTKSTLSKEYKKLHPNTTTHTTSGNRTKHARHNRTPLQHNKQAAENIRNTPPKICYQLLLMSVSWLEGVLRVKRRRCVGPWWKTLDCDGGKLPPRRSWRRRWREILGLANSTFCNKFC